jgi:hypothetical protein
MELVGMSTKLQHTLQRSKSHIIIITIHQSHNYSHHKLTLKTIQLKIDSQLLSFLLHRDFSYFLVKLLINLGDDLTLPLIGQSPYKLAP